MTGDTRHPQDKGVYMNNVESTVKRIRNHPSLAYYVCSNAHNATTRAPLLTEEEMRLSGMFQHALLKKLLQSNTVLYRKLIK